MKALFTFTYKGIILTLSILGFTLLSYSQDDKFWGMTAYGGANGAGVIFTVDQDGTNYNVEHNFNTSSGAYPYASLFMASDGIFYGTTYLGGTGSKGVIFKYDNTTGTYTKIHDFTGTDGHNPSCTFIETPNGKLYGTTWQGGTSNLGVLFELDITQSPPVFTKKIDFTGTNGSYLQSGLMITSDDRIFGVTQTGGATGVGVIFEYNYINNLITVHYSFDFTNGRQPFGTMMEASDGNLYAVTKIGGSFGFGNIFKFDPSDNSYTNVHDFNGLDGNQPTGDLIEPVNGILYGLSFGGGYGNGTIYEYDMNSETASSVHSFNNTNGKNPYGTMAVSSNGKLYGMTSYGGSNNAGVLFEFNTSDYSLVKKHDFSYATSGGGGFPFYTKLWTAGEGGSGENQPPVAVCKDITVSTDENCEAVVLVEQVDNGSYDPDGDELTLSLSPEGPFPLGQTEVTLTVTDQNELSNSCSAIITVQDNTPPSITCTELTIELDATGNYELTEEDIALLTSGVSDVCDPSPFISVSPTNFTTADVGNASVNIYAQDASGGFSSVLCSITVIGNSPPVAVCQDVTVTADDNCQAMITAEDIDNGSLDPDGDDITLNLSPEGPYPLGATLVTLTVTDEDGLSSTCSSTITVEDNTPPDIACVYLEIQLDATGNYELTEDDINQLTSGVSDACDPSPFILVSPTTFTTADVGNASVNIYAQDASGGFLSVLCSINVIGNSPPVAVCQDVTVSADDNCQAMVSAEDVDNGSMDPDGDEITLSLSPEGPYPLGETPVTLTVTDAYGNSDLCTATIHVEDDSSPVITTIDYHIELWPPNHKYTSFELEDMVLSVTDNCSDLTIDDVIISKVTSDEPEDAAGGGDGGTVNDIVIGNDCQILELRKERIGSGNGRVYTIHFEVQDESGNLGTASCQVHIPKNNNSGAIDDGPAYEVYGNCGYKSTQVATLTPSEKYELSNYPNPFSNTTTVIFSIEKPGNVKLKVHDTRGEVVAILYNGYANSNQEYKMDLKSENLPEGIYFYSLHYNHELLETKKMILLR